ncbi:outer membrane protein [Liberibacter crescens]|uniref:outer membrane protein n=1 Tax=Liberibacter crescens TaxID=1273132 RepID=UPI001FCBFBF8|nr:outer membrane protein [Liberibacter crescens]
MASTANFAYAADAVNNVDNIPHAASQPTGSNSGNFSWEGAYGGILGGVSATRYKDTDPVTTAEFGTITYTSNEPSKVNITSPAIGGFAGFNFQQENIIYGVEGDLGYAFKKKKISYNLIPDDGSATINVNAKVNTELYGSIRARLGYSLDRALVYATAGWSFSKAKSTQDVSNGDSVTTKKTFKGPTVGVGVDYAITDNIFARAEYRFTPFRKEDNIKAQQHTVLAGIGYKF